MVLDKNMRWILRLQAIGRRDQYAGIEIAVKCMLIFYFDFPIYSVFLSSVSHHSLVVMVITFLSQVFVIISLF